MDVKEMKKADSAVAGRFFYVEKINIYMISHYMVLWYT